MINIDNNLILVKGEDKTESILSWEYDKYKPVINITYRGQKTYTYKASDVKFFKSPETIKLDNKLVLKDGKHCYGVTKILKFDSYARLYYESGYKEVVPFKTIRLIDSELDNEISKHCFDYLNSIAKVIGLRTEKGHNILASRYEKIDFIRADSIMSCYLCGVLKNNKISNDKTAIFPFGFNISQKKAVDNALNNMISVVEGPPGTGKTQTILNIIANAVIRGESVAVVSSNNSATANVFEKLEKYGVDFLVASLGNLGNKEEFINSQTEMLPDLSSWQMGSREFTEKKQLIRHEGVELNEMLSLQVERATLLAELDVLDKEYKHYQNSLQDTNSLNCGKIVFSKRIEANQILEFLSEYQIRMEKGTSLGILIKLKWLFCYGFKNFNFFDMSVDQFLECCQCVYYERRISEIQARLKSIQTRLDTYNFDKKMDEYTQLSKLVFKAEIAKRFTGQPKRNIYDIDQLWKQSEDFIRDYPIVLSTTYSLRSSLSHHFVYDYVIVDEASQVDIATGALAMSCAKKAVIVGDLKQLPNVVTSETKKITDTIFSKYKLNTAYSYAENSLLSSIIKLFPDIPRVLLREHYRCHPDIIGFCNQRFYNNELIVMTKPKSNKQAMMVYRTQSGDHARGHYNQRQIDTILNEIIPEQKLNINDDSLGIVTPYREQADKLREIFSGTGVKADTADKFQGQERKVMVFSTVDNEIGDFASDPNRLNVAVSRAKEQFIVVTDGNDRDGTSPIHDLIGYIEYHNYAVIDSKISSVFDYLYSRQSLARQEVLKKYGRIAEVDSENLMYKVIREVLGEDEFLKYDVVPHVPLRDIINVSKLSGREFEFARNPWSHVDFLIFSKLSHMPILVIEVDGFAYHYANEKQIERDSVKNNILDKYGIPIVRFSTVGSGEENKLRQALKNL